MPTFPTKYHVATMPGLYKKLVVIAAVEGLILQPHGQRNQLNLQIKYKTHEISSLGSSIHPGSSASTEVHGIVGIQSLSSSNGPLTDECHP